MNHITINNIKRGQVFAIIPARAGSKGVKDKNIRLLSGHPLIAYTIAAARQAKEIERVIVSTDSEDYAKIALDYGAEAPFLRPKEISGDKATDLEFMQHAIQWFYENEKSVPEYWVHLRTTCPLREEGIIDRAIEMMKNRPDATSLLSVNEPTDILTPYKWLKKDGEQLKSIFFDTVDEANMPRQSYPKAYIRTVIVDILKTETIISDGSMYGKNVLSFETDYVYDIDDMKSFEQCEEGIKNGLYGYLAKYLKELS